VNLKKSQSEAGLQKQDIGYRQRRVYVLCVVLMIGLGGFGCGIWGWMVSCPEGKEFNGKKCVTIDTSPDPIVLTDFDSAKAVSLIKRKCVACHETCVGIYGCGEGPGCFPSKVAAHGSDTAKGWDRVLARMTKTHEKIYWFNRNQAIDLSRTGNESAAESLWRTWYPMNDERMALSDGERLLILSWLVKYGGR
jgi:hypothetical protein